MQFICVLVALLGLGLGASASSNVPSCSDKPEWSDLAPPCSRMMGHWGSQSSQDVNVTVPASASAASPVQVLLPKLPAHSLIFVDVVQGEVWSLQDGCGFQSNAAGLCASSTWCSEHSSCGGDGVQCIPQEPVETCTANGHRLVTAKGSLVGSFSWDSWKSDEQLHPYRKFGSEGSSCLFVPAGTDEGDSLFLWNVDDEDHYGDNKGFQNVVISFNYPEGAVIDQLEMEALTYQNRVNVFPLQALIGILTVVVLALIAIVIVLVIKVRATKATLPTPADDYLLQ